MTFNGEVVPCNAVFFPAVSILAVILPITSQGRSIAWVAAGSVYYIGIEFTLPEGYVMAEPCLGWGGSRNQLIWPGQVVYNGREGSVYYYAATQSQQPYQLFLYVKVALV